MTNEDKTIEVRISISTDSRTAHIGRYFIDVRDTTRGQNRQMTTRVFNAEEARQFMADLIKASRRHGITVIGVDNTKEGVLI